MPQFTLLNTRPVDQAAALQKRVEIAGGQALSCPTIEIEMLALPSPRRVELESFDKLIFISANAVEAFAAHFPSHSELSIPMFAIGRATLKAGQKAGLEMLTARGERFDSEALLAHPELEDLSGQRVLIVKGQGGRELLESRLLERGAQVTAWELYRRKPMPLCVPAWKQFMDSAQPIVLATSVSGLHSLMEAVAGAENPSTETQQTWSDWLYKQPLVVFSERIQQWAQGHGWQGDIAIVPTQSDDGIMQSITTIVRKRES